MQVLERETVTEMAFTHQPWLHPVLPAMIGLSSAKIRFTLSSWPVKALDRAICRRIVLHLSLTDPYHFAQALILGPEGAQRQETAHQSRYFQRTRMRHRHTDDTESCLWTQPLPEIGDIDRDKCGTASRPEK